MSDRDRLVGRFEAHRAHLRAVAHRMLGSPAEADDAVQETWLRLVRADPDGVRNIGGWLTTIVCRVCVDMLRTRGSQREDLRGTHPPDQAADRNDHTDPERAAMLGESVGAALAVILETLGPAERLALVFHDMFDVPFDDIAPLVGRSPTAARKLASRARRRLRESPATPGTDRAGDRQAVRAFVAAARDGDFTALLAVLDPDIDRARPARRFAS